MVLIGTRGSLTPPQRNIPRKATTGFIFLSNLHFPLPRYSTLCYNGIIYRRTILCDWDGRKLNILLLFMFKSNVINLKLGRNKTHKYSINLTCTVTNKAVLYDSIALADTKIHFLYGGIRKKSMTNRRRPFSFLSGDSICKRVTSFIFQVLLRCFR